jgi:LPXTG-motif cell wall-anchored protein
VGQLPSQLRPHVTAPLTTPRVGQIPTQLPHTGSGGTAFLPVVALGIIFLCVGVVLRRRSRRA